MTKLLLVPGAGAVSPARATRANPLPPPSDQIPPSVLLLLLRLPGNAIWPALLRAGLLRYCVKLSLVPGAEPPVSATVLRAALAVGCPAERRSE